MTDTRVRTATQDDEAGVIDVITLGFSTDPMTRWSLPDPRRYLAVMPAVVRAFGGKAFAHGGAHVVDGFAGAALWLPPGEESDTEQLVTLLTTNAPPENRPHMHVIFEKMGTFHPTEPHWYLPLIGVDPVWQGRGHGSALLGYALARCDEDGVAAYLESSNQRNISLYERHGFQKLGTIQAGSSPLVTPMLRPARSARRE